MIVSRMSNEQIIEKFVSIGMQQFELRQKLLISKFNVLYKKQRELAQELARRAGDQRYLLKALYSHPNNQVRLNAAKNTLAIVRSEARAVLEDIEKNGKSIESMDAGMCLWALDEGIFKPV